MQRANKINLTTGAAGLWSGLAGHSRVKYRRTPIIVGDIITCLGRACGD
jgi:hypothetical protein